MTCPGRRYQLLTIRLLTTVLLTATIVTQDHRQGAGGARVPAPTVDQTLTDAVLTGAVDLHAHSDPDSYRRSVDRIEAATIARQGAYLEFVSMFPFGDGSAARAKTALRAQGFSEPTCIVCSRKTRRRCSG